MYTDRTLTTNAKRRTFKRILLRYHIFSADTMAEAIQRASCTQVTIKTAFPVDRHLHIATPQTVNAVQVFYDAKGVLHDWVFYKSTPLFRYLCRSELSQE